MNDILLATIPAVIVLVAMLSVRFVEHCLQTKREKERQKVEREREARDARRRYRESIIKPIRDALDKTNLVSHSRIKSLVEAEKLVVEKGISLEPETKKAMEIVRELNQKAEIKNFNVILIELLPLVAGITDEEARKAVEQALLDSALPERMKQVLGLAGTDVEQKVKLAYQKLEDFVTLAD